MYTNNNNAIIPMTATPLSFVEYFNQQEDKHIRTEWIKHVNDLLNFVFEEGEDLFLNLKGIRIAADALLEGDLEWDQISEFVSDHGIAELPYILEYFEAVENTTKEVVEDFLEEQCGDCAYCEHVEDAYHGCWESGADYAQELVEDCYFENKNPWWVETDWNATWENLSQDYWISENGHVFATNFQINLRFDPFTGVFLWYYKGMEKTITFTSEELRLISDLFSTVASLDLYHDDAENEQDSDPDLFDKTWDKVVS